MLKYYIGTEHRRLLYKQLNLINTDLIFFPWPTQSRLPQKNLHSNTHNVVWFSCRARNSICIVLVFWGVGV